LSRRTVPDVRGKTDRKKTPYQGRKKISEEKERRVHDKRKTRGAKKYNPRQSVLEEKRCAGSKTEKGEKKERSWRRKERLGERGS